jgi:beta-glucanase (GH16 family)
MKKFIYLCSMILLSMNVVGQINDVNNWLICFNEQFQGDRWWDRNTFTEQSNAPNFSQRWDCMSKEMWPYYVTTSERSHQAYQRSHARFCNDQKMRLVAECKSPYAPLVCANGDYELPQNAHCSYTYNGKYYPPHTSIFYYSGTIETTQYDCWFGYYEIKCQLPVHPGEGSAFWLFGTGPNTYEEIDIFEHSLGDSKATGSMATDFSCGIWYNPEGKNYYPDTINGIIYDGAHNYSKKYLAISENNDLTHEHIFGLEWLPNRITWYFDGQVVNECTNRDSIPQHSLSLKVTHAVKDDALSNTSPKIPAWTLSDEMVIDYVKYYKIRTDCDTDVIIANANDWGNCIGGVKSTITIGSPSGIIVPSNSNKCFRASESITITSEGEFTLPLGAQMTLMTHDCVDY